MSIQVYKGEILLSEPELANTQWEKAKGLMFSKQHDVLFHFSEEKRLHFHMVFVFYPIDIVFLDDDLKVVDLKPRFRPFTFYYSKAKSSTVIEAYDGFINDHTIRVGDELSIVHEGEINMASDAPPTPPALERKSVFHGTSLGKPREAKVEPGSAQGIAPAPKKSAKKTKASAKPRSSSKAKSSSTKSSAKKTPKKSPKKPSPKKATKKSSPKKPSKSKASAASKKSSAKKTKTSAKSESSSKSKPAAKKSSKSKASAPSKRTAAKSSSKSASKKSTGSTKSAASKPKKAKASSKKPAPKKSSAKKSSKSSK